MGFIIKYVWEWATKEVKPVISEANTVLIALIDRIRMLDNDLIRLNQKVNTVLMNNWVYLITREKKLVRKFIKNG